MRPRYRLVSCILGVAFLPRLDNKLRKEKRAYNTQLFDPLGTHFALALACLLHVEL